MNVSVDVFRSDGFCYYLLALTSYEGKGKTDGGAVAVAAAVSLLGGIFMKGSGVVYEPGTSFMVEVKNDTDLQCTPENLAKAMDPTVPRGQVIYVPVK